MGLNLNSSKWKKVHRLVTIISVQLVWLFILNLNPVYAMPGQSEDLNGIQDCISFNVAATDIPAEVDRLCGKLIILKDLKFEKYYLGLQVCGGGDILIFQTRPRELLNYYQLREAKIGKGAKISTELGDFTHYITTFESYIPISDCSECGKILTPTPRELVGTPEGTQSLVFPTATIGLPTATFTRTPVPTPTVPSPTPTIQPTKTGFHGYCHTDRDIYTASQCNHHHADHREDAARMKILPKSLIIPGLSFPGLQLLLS